MAGTSLDDLLSQLPVGDIARKLGVDESVANGAIAQALPQLLGGMSKNIRSAEGLNALESALDDHRTDGALPAVDTIDAEDGKKIVRHVLGDSQDQVARGLSMESLSGGNLLAVLAPIVMSYLGNNKSSTPSSGGGLGEILGGMLGGAGGGLGDMLGGVLGGGDDEPATTSKKTTSKRKTSTTSQKKSGGFLSSILGKILGK